MSDSTAATDTVAAPAAFTVTSYLNEDKLKLDIMINGVDLDGEMIRYASIMLNYRINTAHARKQYERMKAGAEILEATIDADVRSAPVADGAKKLPEAGIKAAIYADNRYKRMQTMLIDSKFMYDLCVAAENSMDSKKDMLLEVARDRRKEMEGNLSVRALQAGKDAFIASRA